MKKTDFLSTMVSAVLILSGCATEEEIPDDTLEPAPRPVVEFSRQGHLDVTAEMRSLAWKVAESGGLKSLDVQIVRVADGSMEPETVYQSQELSGEVDLTGLNKGPGQYAILAVTTDASGNVSKTGMRFSYAALNPDCPSEKAWWPNNKTVDFQARDNNPPKAKTYEVLSTGNLLSLSRHASLVVTGVVSNLIACATKEGGLFTYVVLDDVKPLRHEGQSNMSEQLVLRVPGGMAHGRVEIVTDAPIFRQGDQALLFLGRDPQSHMPILGGADGVFLIENGRDVRSYSGPNVVGIGDDYNIELDATYRPNAKHLRHYDPNMRAVIVNPKPSAGITKTEDQRPSKPKPAISLDEFAEKLERAWTIADRTGRLPARVNLASRPSYNGIPSQETQP